MNSNGISLAVLVGVINFGNGCRDVVREYHQGITLLTQIVILDFGCNLHAIIGRFHVEQGVKIRFLKIFFFIDKVERTLIFKSGRVDIGFDSLHPQRVPLVGQQKHIQGILDINGLAERSQAETELGDITRFDRIEILLAGIFQELVAERHGFGRYRHGIARMVAKNRVLVFNDKSIAGLT